VKDLRSFLRALEQVEPIVDVTRAVSYDRELPAVVKLLESKGNPVVYFDHVAESDMPVICGVHGTRERIALALGSPLDRALDDYVDRVTRGVAPVVTSSAPVKDVIRTGDQVDIGQLPIPIHADKDGGRFLTAAVGVALDHANGNVNTGIYRMMVLDRNHLTVGTGGHLRDIIEEAHAAGREMELVIAVGHHPAFQVSSQAKVPRTQDSLEVAGALLGEPLAIASAETVDVPVPAAAEIVLEGRFVPGRTEPDGPFGESPRYYESGYGYVLEVTAVTHRSDAVFMDINNVHQEHRCLSTFPAREGQLLAALRAVYPHTRAVLMPLSTAAMHAYISIDPTRDGEARQVLLVALGSNPRLKHAVVVDTDVDITDHEHVLWALTTRFQGDRDLIVVPNVSGTSMDPSSYTLDDRFAVGELRTQVGFDATKPVSLPFRERADIVGSPYDAIDLEEYVVSDDEPAAAPWRAGGHVGAPA
jgi:2,5-furandicarboxylate decarboxylase 1